MNIYLAASWSRRAEMQRLTKELERDIPGLKVVSRWITEPGGLSGNLLVHGKSSEASRPSRAVQDREDVYAADILVRFTDDLSTLKVPAHLATGSRMAEMGMAIRGGTPCIVVGGKQCIFDYLPEVQHVKNIVALKQLLRRLSRAEKKADRDHVKILKRAVNRLAKRHQRACTMITRFSRQIGV